MDARDRMAMAQKTAQDIKDEALRAANLVFSSLETPRYQPILPVGISSDRLGLTDFFSGQSHTFKLFNVRSDEVQYLLDQIVGKLTAALVKYEPSVWKTSQFAATDVSYKEKGGELEFTLKIVDRAAVLVKK